MDLSGRAEMVSAAMSELKRAGAVASGKMFAETVEFEEWDNLIDDQRYDFMSAASSIKGQMGAEAHAKVLASKRGVECKLFKLDLLEQEKIVSAAIGELKQIGPQAHTKVLASKREFK